MSLVQHDQFVWKKSNIGAYLERAGRLKSGDEILCINKKFFPEFSKIKIDIRPIAK